MSALEETLASQLRLMRHAANPWPEFVRELHLDWCCECPKREHLMNYDDPPEPHCDGCCPGLARNCLHEYRHGRNYRADFAFLAPYNLLIEVDGAVFTSGRHTRGKGWEEDARKQARAVELGYRVLRFSGGQVKSGEAVNAIGACLGVGNG